MKRLILYSKKLKIINPKTNAHTYSIHTDIYI